MPNANEGKGYTMTDAAREARRKGAAATNKIRGEKTRKRGGYTGVHFPVYVVQEIDARRGKLPRWQFVAQLLGLKEGGSSQG